MTADTRTQIGTPLGNREVVTPVKVKKTVRRGWLRRPQVVEEDGFQVTQEPAGVVLETKTSVKGEVAKKVGRVEELMRSGASESDVQAAKVAVFKELSKAVRMDSELNSPKKLAKGDMTVDIAGNIALALVTNAPEGSLEGSSVRLLGVTPILSRPEMEGGKVYTFSVVQDGIERTVKYIPVNLDTAVQDEALATTDATKAEKNPYVQGNIIRHPLPIGGEYEFNVKGAHEAASADKRAKLTGYMEVAVELAQIPGNNGKVEFTQPEDSRRYFTVNNRPGFMDDATVRFLTRTLKKPQPTGNILA